MGRRKRFLSGAAVLASFASGMVPAAWGSPYIHETWTKADSPHIFEHDVVIDSRTSLMVEGGAEVRFGDSASLRVQGILGVNGTTDEPVLFTSTAPDVEWGGIAFEKSGFPNYQSSLVGAVIENASHAVVVHKADAVVERNVFRNNRLAFRAINPQYDLTLRQNVFEGNGLAVSGYTRNAISFYENDFWNNEVNLLAEPQPMWDCGEDDGVWTLTDNDILRGPVNSEFYSNDVQTEAGSATSNYTVVATRNWWGTTDEDKISARMRPEIDCCPTPAEKEVVWDPPETEPQTPYAPTGEVPDPEDSGALHGDPGVVTEYGFPQHGACYRSTRSLRGTAQEILADSEKAKLALRRETISGCSWWDHTERTFRSGGCFRKQWWRVGINETDGSWSYTFGRRLPRGRYMAWSYGVGEPTHVGRNQIAFRVR